MTDYLAENQCHKCGKKLNTGFKCDVCDTMADKEERIFICSKKKICQICKDECEEFDGIVPCGNCGYADFPSMTRQEAIDVIKQALEQICWPNSFNDIIAETALNALLGERNEER